MPLRRCQSQPAEPPALQRTGSPWCKFRTRQHLVQAFVQCFHVVDRNLAIHRPYCISADGQVLLGLAANPRHEGQHGRRFLLKRKVDLWAAGVGRAGEAGSVSFWKRIAAALLMANLQANLRSQCAIALEQPQRLLRSVNQLFYENTADNAYATLFFAEYDDKVRRLTYVNCGHVSALLIRSDSTVDRLHSTCTVLGIFKEWDCSKEEAALFCGDT